MSQQVLTVSDHWKSFVDVAKIEKSTFISTFFLIPLTLTLRKKYFSCFYVTGRAVIGFCVTLEFSGLKFGILFMCKPLYCKYCMQCI